MNKDLLEYAMMLYPIVFFSEKDVAEKFPFKYKLFDSLKSNGIVQPFERGLYCLTAEAKENVIGNYKSLP